MSAFDNDLDKIINAITSSDVSLSDINVAAIIERIEETPMEPEAKTVTPMGPEAKTVTPRMLRIGSGEIREQDGPSCASHALASAIRGAIKWRNEKYNPRRLVQELSAREAKIRDDGLKDKPIGPNTGPIIMTYPEHAPLQEALDKKLQQIMSCAPSKTSFENAINHDILTSIELPKKLEKYFGIKLTHKISFDQLIKELDARPEETGTQFVLGIRWFKTQDTKNFNHLPAIHNLHENHIDETTVFDSGTQIEAFPFWSAVGHIPLEAANMRSSYELFPTLNIPEEQLHRSFAVWGAAENITYQRDAHLMYISGYGKKDGKYYLEIKNSWGDYWGFNGKIRLSVDLFRNIGKSGSEQFKEAPYRTQFVISKLKPYLDTRLPKTEEALAETLELRGGKNTR